VVNYLFAQFSGASWYPLIYDYDEQKMHELSKEKRLNKLKSIKKLMDRLNPDVYIPCAGPPCFLDEKIFPLNFKEENTFPTQADVYNYLKDDYNTVLLLPGDEISIDDDFKKISKINLQAECYKDKKKYLKNYYKKRKGLIQNFVDNLDEVDGSLLKKCKRYFIPLMLSSDRLCKNINCSIMLNIQGSTKEKIIIDFKNIKNSIRHFNNDKYFYEFILDGKWLNLILDKKITWEDFFLSLRFKARRHPDKYSEHLMAFLKLADSNAYKNYENFHFGRRMDNEVFVLEHGGNKYKCQKYCPHAKADLSEGEVVDGNLVCPLHHWKFSLKDGKCLNNNSKIIMELQK